LRNRLNDFSMNLGDFSTVYTKADLFKICFDLRSKMLPFN